MSDLYPRYRHLYDDKPFNAELMAFVSEHHQELASRCRSLIPTPANRTFDDVYHDAICLFVVGRTPSSAPVEVKAAEFLKCFKRICIAGMYDVHKQAELRMFGDASDALDE